MASRGKMIFNIVCILFQINLLNQNLGNGENDVLTCDERGNIFSDYGSKGAWGKIVENHTSEIYMGNK